MQSFFSLLERTLAAAGHVPSKIWEVFQLSNTGEVVVIMTNILCPGSRRLQQPIILHLADNFIHFSRLTRGVLVYRNDHVEF